MVGPVNTAATQTQQAISNPFQQQNNRQVDDQRDQDNATAKASQTQETGKIGSESKGAGKNIVQTASSEQSQSSGQSGRGQERGSVLDISV